MPKQPFIVGNPALIVIDIQASTFIDDSDERSIPNMEGYRARMAKARDLVDGARKARVPVIFIQEAHRPDLVDFGRELDGSETVHCLEGDPRTGSWRRITRSRNVAIRPFLGRISRSS